MVVKEPKAGIDLPELAARQLAKFTDSKLQEYVEPTKKGTPKGEAVGFSHIKYKATLLALRESVLDNAQDLKAQARELGISYGVLRKWRSEEKFKDLVAKHEKEFITHLLNPLMYSGYALLNAHDEQESMVLQALQSKTMQKESARKLMILIYGKIQDELMNSDASRADLRKYQMVALNQAIELLGDRPSAIKHRKDVISLLSGIRKSMA